jgi:hypothetical protein
MPNRRNALIAAALFLAAPAVALAQPPGPPPMYSPEDEAAIRSIVDRYFAAITVRDYAAIEQIAHAPYVIWGPEFALIPTMDGVMERYRKIRDALDPSDYALSRAIEVRVKPLHGRVAMAHVHWERLKKDGGRLNEGAEVLVMSKIGADWKISGNFGETVRDFRAN